MHGHELGAALVGFREARRDGGLAVLTAVHTDDHRTDASRLLFGAGVTYDNTNRDDDALSPIIEIARESTGSSPDRIYFSYSESTQVPTYTALKSNSAAARRTRPGAGLRQSQPSDGWCGQ